ncbi:MAG: Dabb family protein [Lachnospiraceae bacterium]
MIRHVYLFKLKDPSRRREAAEKLLTLKERVPEIAHIEVGLDFKGAENSYDLCECVSFKNREDFLAFGENAYHAEIRAYMASVQEDGVKIDYEI